MISILIILLILLVLGCSASLVALFISKKQVAKLSHIVLNNPLPILCVDQLGQIVLANQASSTLVLEWELKIGGGLPQELLGFVSRALAKNKLESTTTKMGSRIYHIIFDPDKAFNTVSLYVQDVTQQKKIEQDLVKGTIYDLVTDLPNRALFYDYLKLELTHKRKGYKIFVMVIKLIDYVSILNRYGDGFCKKMLNVVRLQLKRFLSEEGTLAKLGEKEFGMIESIYFEEYQVAELCKKIVTYFEGPMVIDQTELISRVAIGVSNFPEDGNTHEILLRNAKMAQQQALRNASYFSFYHIGLNEEVEAKRSLLLDLHNALDSAEFSIVYQPQVLVLTGECVGAEALIRWKHPELGVISPLVFLPVAELSGMIIPIGHWIIETVFQDLVRWQKKDLKRWTKRKIAINLSSAQFTNKKIIQDICDLLEQSGLLPENIEFEITESILIQDIEEVIKTMEALKQYRFSLAIDDFGTGYSSLSYLKKLPIQKLKIDKAFIDDIEHHEPSLAMVKSIIELGHNLGLKVLAEGVENKNQVEILKELKCDLIQGYYFSRPISGDDFEKF